MKKLLLIPLLMPVLALNAQKLNNFLQPEVWLRADQLQNNEYWNDVSGNQYNAVPTGNFVLSANDLINYNKAIAFDGSDDKMNIPYDLSSSSQLTILAVYNSKGTLDERGIWGATINPGQDVVLSTQKITGPQSIDKYSDGNINMPVVNTTSQYWGKAGSGVPGASICLGSTSGKNGSLNSFSGDIAEFMVFNRLVTGVELQILQSYLSLKYGATLQYSDYLTSNGKVIWNYDANPEYSVSVAGIGRDDAFDLYQKQSSSDEEPGLMVIGAGHIAVSNDANTATINKNDFLLWGSNGKDLVPEKSDSEIYPYKYPVSERKWLMSVTGNSAADIPTEIQFNAKGLLGIQRQCYLVIDRSGTGNFASQNIEYIPADSISADGIADFQNIMWDTDGSGSDMFSFSFGMNNGITITSPICHDAQTGAIHTGIMGGVSPYTFSLTSDSLAFKKDWTSNSRFQDIENLLPGNYTLIVHDADGNIARSNITITNPGGFSTGLVSEYTLYPGKTLTLDAGKNIYDRFTSFVWQGTDNFYSEGKDVTISEPGQYTLTISDQNGCSTSEKFAVSAPQGVYYHYQLYPNPSKGDYRLEISLAEAAPVDIRIYNTEGALLDQQHGEGSVNYEFRGYLNRSGLYLIKIITGFGTETFKLIVSHE